jgi:hypothetical protein
MSSVNQCIAQGDHKVPVVRSGFVLVVRRTEAEIEQIIQVSRWVDTSGLNC